MWPKHTLSTSILIELETTHPQVKAAGNTVLLKIDKPSEDTKIVGGVELAIDTTYEVERNARIHGTIYSIPRGLELKVEVEDEYGQQKMLDAPMEVREGERCYFHYHITSSRNKQGQFKNRINLEPDLELWKADYSQLFCVVRNGEVIPVNSHVFVKPIVDEAEQLPSGIYVPKMVSSRPKSREGIVWKVGKRLDGHSSQIKEGDHISFGPHCNFENIIEGEKVWILKHEDVDGVLQSFNI